MADGETQKRNSINDLVLGVTITNGLTAAKCTLELLLAVADLPDASENAKDAEASTVIKTEATTALKAIQTITSSMIGFAEPLPSDKVTQ